MTLRDIQDGQKFILKRTGMKYKKLHRDGCKVAVKPVNHYTGLLSVFGKPMRLRPTIHMNSEAIPCSQ